MFVCVWVEEDVRCLHPRANLEWDAKGNVNGAHTPPPHPTPRSPGSGRISVFVSISSFKENHALVISSALIFLFLFTAPTDVTSLTQRTPTPHPPPDLKPTTGLNSVMWSSVQSHTLTLTLWKANVPIIGYIWCIERGHTAAGQVQYNFIVLRVNLSTPLSAS